MDDIPPQTIQVNIIYYVDRQIKVLEDKYNKSEDLRQLYEKRAQQLNDRLWIAIFISGVSLLISIIMLLLEFLMGEL